MVTTKVIGSIGGKRGETIRGKVIPILEIIAANGNIFFVVKIKYGLEKYP
jgi:hypothetical protein